MDAKEDSQMPIRKEVGLKGDGKWGWTACLVFSEFGKKLALWVGWDRANQQRNHTP